MESRIGKNTSRKPSLKDFEAAAKATRGTVGKISEAFGVTRRTVINWCNKDQKFRDAIEEWRGALLDECIKSARALAIGIPKLDSNKKIIGWKERPDSLMLRYLLGTLGRNEGFGENIDITSKGESIKPDPVVVEVIDRREQVAKNEEDEG